jgi:hypothetical protein
VAKFRVWAEGGREAFAAINEVSAQATGIAVASRLDRPPTHDHWTRLLRGVEESANPPLPLPSSVLEEE